MRYLEKKFSKQDRIIAKARFSTWTFFSNFLLALIVGGILAAIWVYAPTIESFFTKSTEVVHLTETNLSWALLGCFLFVGLVFLMSLSNFFQREMVVTEHYLVYRHGVSIIRTSAIPLDEIKVLECKQSSLQMLLRYGSLVIVTESYQNIEIKKVTLPDRLSKKIIRQIQLTKQGSMEKAFKLQLAPAVKKNRQF